MLELFLQLVGEFLLQAFAEALAEFGLHALAEPFRKRPHPVVAAIGLAMLGVLAGASSLLLLPHHLVTSPTLRWINLLLVPIAAGALMSIAGRWRRGRGDAVLSIDRFAYGYVFALAMATVRFVFAH
jgi:uncharacterized membrane protein